MGAGSCHLVYDGRSVSFSQEFHTVVNVVVDNLKGFQCYVLIIRLSQYDIVIIVVMTCS